MTKDEALRLALEALQFALHVGFDESSESQIKKGNKATQQHRQAITAIKAALEAKDEPVAWMRTSGTGSPVVTKELLAEMPEMRWNFQQPLYTTPPQRTWVGLTTDERRDLCRSWSSPMDAIHATEAKLKEKNT
jgi:hypothetical protein